jgi:crotonobetaine/carnitine-CoA ligase
MASACDKRIPDPQDCILPYILARQAGAEPDSICAVFEGGKQWTYADAFNAACQIGSGLRRAGVKRGDKVLVWMPNGPMALGAWFGINTIGAVFVGINTAYRGALLTHVIENSDAAVLLCHPELAERLLDLEGIGDLKVVFTDLPFVKGRSRFELLGLRICGWEHLQGSADPDLPVEGLMPWDVQAICYTSGTTGPSKGVLSSYLHLFTMGWECTVGTDASDRWLINLPLFHVGGTLFVYGALSRAGSIAVLASFTTDTFLDRCRSLGATACVLLASMATFLVRQPPSQRDRDHALRRVMVLPLNEDAPAIAERFGFAVFTVFNMSEISCPIRSEDNPSSRGSCGRLRPGVEARVVDQNDCEVAVGAVGELILRSDAPWTMSHGYYKNSEATASSWRNGWFHTGDAFRVDSEGNYFFVDRMKDAIRRRGENISSFEVEAEILAHPGVLEAAVVGVPSEYGEEDVLAAIVPKPDVNLSNDELIGFLSRRMPHFMVPRYIRHMQVLPKTPTAKIEKHVLRSDGITGKTWDREAAGIRISRDRLSN